MLSFLSPCRVDTPHLHPQDAEDDEEGAADEDYVADGLEGGDERLHYQLQPRGPADDPVGRQGRPGYREPQPTERQPQLSPRSPGLAGRVRGGRFQQEMKML